MTEVLDLDAPPDWDLLLHEAIGGTRIGLVFQPIVDLQSVRVTGYETLARFDGPRGLGPDRWFAAARERGLAEALDAAVVARALARWRTIPRNCFLTVNVEPGSVASRDLDAVIGRSSRLDGLVLEVTEHVPVDGYGELLGALDRYRAMGASVAVDDAGAGYAGLQHILSLRPSFLKLDRSLVAGLDTDEAKRALVEMLGVFANHIDSWLIAEGIERPEEAATLRLLGVPLGQGYLLARPAPPWVGLDDDAARVLRAVGSSGASGAGGLVDLLTPTAWIEADELPQAGTLLEASGMEHLVVVDGTHRAVGLVDRAAAIVGTMAEPCRANVGTDPAELAARVATQAGALPALVVCHDDTGRYAGTVSLRRLLAHLAHA